MPLLRELGLDARWHVMEGGADFFDVTKAFHNSLQGGTYKLGEPGFGNLIEIITVAIWKRFHWMRASW